MYMRRAPSGNTIDDINDHPGARQLAVKMQIGLILKLNWAVGHYIPSSIS